mmetsp:Transcript_111/g.231  ORF Transcript_111/g.231 Transcript_111/m.231 type:complete len:360 (+) Transcript_111:74-1153(+)
MQRFASGKLCLDEESLSGESTTASSPCTTPSCEMPIEFVPIVGKAGWALLKEILSSCPEDPDTHLSSPAYYMHTCRKGLWLCKLAGSEGPFAFAGRHPNVEDAWLVFPQPCHVDVNFISRVCALLPKCSGGVRVARIKEGSLPLFEGKSQFQWVEELVLDWRFDCMVLSTQMILEASGSAFSSFRKEKHYIAMEHVESKIVQSEADAAQVKKLFDDWADSVSDQKLFSKDNLIEPNMSGLLMALDPEENVTGVLISYHNEPIGFCAFEVLPGCKTSAGVSMAVNRAIRGASAFCYWEICRHCLQMGFEEFNINGAETESLNAFRRKLKGGLSRSYKIHSFDWVAEGLDHPVSIKAFSKN